MRIERIRFRGLFSFAFVYANPLESIAIKRRMKTQRNIFKADDYTLPGMVIRPAAGMRGAQFVIFSKASGVIRW